MSFFLVLAVFIVFVVLLRSRTNAAIRKAQREIWDEEDLRREVKALNRQFVIWVVLVAVVLVVGALFLSKVYFDWTFYEEHTYLYK